MTTAIAHKKQLERKKKRDTQDTTYISLPFIDDTLARRVDGVASALNARVAWVSGEDVGQICDPVSSRKSSLSRWMQAV